MVSKKTVAFVLFIILSVSAFLFSYVTALEPVNASASNTTPINFNLTDADIKGNTNLSWHDQFLEGYKYLPKEKIPTGILLDVGSFFFKTEVLDSKGEYPDSDDDYLSTDEYVGASGDLLQGYINEQPLADFLNFSDNNQSNLVQYYVEKGNIQTISISAIKYNYLDPDAIKKGNLKLVFKDGSNVPDDYDFEEETQRYYVETEKGKNSTYVKTGKFTAAALMRDTVIIDEDRQFRFIIPKELLSIYQMGKIRNIEIKFVNIPQNENNPDAFLPIKLNTLYSANFSNADFAFVNGSWKVDVKAILKFDMADGTKFAPFDFQVWDPKPLIPHCSQHIVKAQYPDCRPVWWPEDEWNNKPADPTLFFTDNPQDRPVWWPQNMPWPTTQNWYGGFPSICDGQLMDIDQFFGRLEYDVDKTIWGPLYNAKTGEVGVGPQGGENWAGGINWRLYPAAHRAADPNRCQAENLVVVVDGIDITQTRSTATIYNDFKPVFEELSQKGYDVLILDYTNGRDYIQRNGYALAEVFKQIPGTFMKPGYESHDAIVLSGSMGTQTARYGLAKLEEQNIDHHIGLWISLDGPFVGAHVPWSIQGMVEFFSILNKAAKPNYEGLSSPAAKQLLRHHTNYLPDQLHIDYYTEADALKGGTGLPDRLRKVAISSGSGSGFSTLSHQLHDNPSLGNDYVFDSVLHKAQISPFFPNMDLEAWTEKYTCGGVGQWVFFGKASLAVTILKFKWDMCKGMTDTDVAPGGYRTSGADTAEEYNEQNPPRNMSSQLENHAFIPFFSALYLKDMDDYGNKMKVHVKKFQGTVVGGWWDSTKGDQPSTNYWYGPEDQALFPYRLDPNIEKSPFDAIWYHETNVQHVVEAGVMPLESEKSFIYNEMDKFTSQESVSTQNINNGNLSLKTPARDIVLIGDLNGCGEDELFTVNTFKKTAMIQYWAGGKTWEQLWNTSLNINNWTINKGDRFYLADVTGDAKKELIFMSADVPAKVQVYNFSTIHCPAEEQEAYWKLIWDNGNSGKLGPWTVHTTDIYSFGNFDASTSNGELAVVYPYIGNNEREKLAPGTGGRSRAEVLRFSNGAWVSLWNNYQGGQIHFMGESWPIRFGDVMESGKFTPNANESTLFTLNNLRNVFGGRVQIQQFNAGAYNGWFNVWADDGAPTNFGNWYLGDPEDMYYVSDFNGDNIDEIFSTNDQWAHLHQYNQTGFNWTFIWGVGPAQNSTIVGYNLSTGDRFAIGQIDPKTSREQILAYNPMKQGPLMLLKYKPDGNWSQVWKDQGNRKLGYWQMYQDKKF